jgi:hypothetical protein
MGTNSTRFLWRACVWGDFRAWRESPRSTSSVHPVRAVARAEHGGEPDRVQINDLVRVSGFAQARVEALEDGVAERSRPVMCEHGQHFHLLEPLRDPRHVYGKCNALARRAQCERSEEQPNADSWLSAACGKSAASAGVSQASKVPCGQCAEIHEDLQVPVLRWIAWRRPAR